MNKRLFVIFSLIVILLFFVMGYWGYLLIVDDVEYHRSTSGDSSTFELFEIS